MPTLTSARLLWGSHFAASVLCLNGAGHVGVSMLSVMGVCWWLFSEGLVDAHGSPLSLAASRGSMDSPSQRQVSK